MSFFHVPIRELSHPPEATAPGIIGVRKKNYCGSSSQPFLRREHKSKAQQPYRISPSSAALQKVLGHMGAVAIRLTRFLWSPNMCMVSLTVKSWTCTLESAAPVMSTRSSAWGKNYRRQRRHSKQRSASKEGKHFPQDSLANSPKGRTPKWHTEVVSTCATANLSPLSLNEWTRDKPGCKHQPLKPKLSVSIKGTLPEDAWSSSITMRLPDMLGHSTPCPHCWFMTGRGVSGDGIFF